MEEDGRGSTQVLPSENESGQTILQTVSGLFEKVQELQSQSNQNCKHLLSESDKMGSLLHSLAKAVPQLGEEMKKENEDFRQKKRRKILQMGKRIKEIQKDLKEKEEQVNYLEVLNQLLIVKELCNDSQLKEAAKVLMDWFKRFSRNHDVGVKIIGDIDMKSIETALNKKCSQEEAAAKAGKLHSLLYSAASGWSPFRVVLTTSGVCEEIIDETDEKLKEIRNLGDDIYCAVTMALKERKEHNLTDGYRTFMMWNYAEERQATLSEVVESIQGKLGNLSDESFLFLKDS